MAIVLFIVLPTEKKNIFGGYMSMSMRRRGYNFLQLILMWKSILSVNQQ